MSTINSYGLTRDVNTAKVRCKLAVFDFFPHDALRTVYNTVCATAILENEKTLGTRLRTSDNPLTRKRKDAGSAETRTQLRSRFSLLAGMTVDSYPGQGNITTQGRIQDFFRRGALVSCSTSTPINHIVFFFAEYQLY